MQYRVRYGCPKCGNRAIRQINREKYQRLTGNLAGYSTPYMCSDENCGHVWLADPAELTMRKRDEKK